MTDVRGQRSEDRGQRSEVRGQRTEVRGQRSEDRRQRTEDRRQSADQSHRYWLFEVGGSMFNLTTINPLTYIDNFIPRLSSLLLYTTYETVVP
jgi:hypothetical protein